MGRIASSGMQPHECSLECWKHCSTACSASPGDAGDKLCPGETPLVLGLGSLLPPGPGLRPCARHGLLQRCPHLLGRHSRLLTCPSVLGHPLGGSITQVHPQLRPPSEKPSKIFQSEAPAGNPQQAGWTQALSQAGSLCAYSSALGGHQPQKKTLQPKSSPLQGPGVRPGKRWCGWDE